VEAVVADLVKKLKKVPRTRKSPSRHYLLQCDVEIVSSSRRQKKSQRGVITVEEAKSLETELEVVEGMRSTGYIRPTRHQTADKMRVEMEDAYVDQREKLSQLNELLPLLEAVVQSGKPLVIAPKTSKRALATLVVNVCVAPQVAAVKAPGFDRRRQMLQDLAF